jgi:N-acetylmuramoyl-L-alanine amidase
MAGQARVPDQGALHSKPSELQRLLPIRSAFPARGGAEKLGRLLRFGYRQFPRHQPCRFSGSQGVGVYIIQLVPETRRAWHAGVSSWAGDTDLNSRSIGIEIANPGHEHGYPDFPRRQIAAVTTLCRSILTRYDVPADRVLAHSDVAPARNVDPGEKFPWKLLANSGIGLWVKPIPLTQGGPINVLGETDPAIEEVQRLLARYGYGVAATGYFDSTTRDAVAAFQRRFRPMRVDGVVDASTIATLRALIAERDAWLSRSTTVT